VQGCLVWESRTFGASKSQPLATFLVPLVATFISGTPVRDKISAEFAVSTC
jgi:hypothetical protein